LIFLDASGGTEKTFLLNLIYAEIRNKGVIALAVASSGVTATLLHGGRTADSALKLPLHFNLTEELTCK
jgi:ATP-dependent DNA helicase PIF1